MLQGADTFKAKVNIEVQLASELAIAAIEESGGVVTTAFCDPRSLGKLAPQSFSSFPLCLMLAACEDCKSPHGCLTCRLDTSVFCFRISY